MKSKKKWTCELKSSTWRVDIDWKNCKCVEKYFWKILKHSFILFEIFFFLFLVEKQLISVSISCMGLRLESNEIEWKANLDYFCWLWRASAAWWPSARSTWTWTATAATTQKECRCIEGQRQYTKSDNYEHLCGIQIIRRENWKEQFEL